MEIIIADKKQPQFTIKIIQLIKIKIYPIQ
jgi:hypothetical protein